MASCATRPKAPWFEHDVRPRVVSQRGTMFSEPALTCASIDDFARVALGLRFYSEATKRAHHDRDRTERRAALNR
jgi:hypothetical protein